MSQEPSYELMEVRCLQDNQLWRSFWFPGSRSRDEGLGRRSAAASTVRYMYI